MNLVRPMQLRIYPPPSNTRYCPQQLPYHAASQQHAASAFTDITPVITSMLPLMMVSMMMKMMTSVTSTKSGKQESKTNKTSEHRSRKQARLKRSAQDNA